MGSYYLSLMVRISDRIIFNGIHMRPYYRLWHIDEVLSIALRIMLLVIHSVNNGFVTSASKVHQY